MKIDITVVREMWRAVVVAGEATLAASRLRDSLLLLGDSDGAARAEQLYTGATALLAGWARGSWRSAAQRTRRCPGSSGS